MDFQGRTQLVDITGICDIDLDEHSGYAWGATQQNPQDLHIEVQRACHCGGKSFWVPLAAARTHGYTG
ncbi:hypothetical protein [Lentzea sp. NBRC 102530]|uniref:hypothetical protein n=1 Tax=Lentzea sp. NBRC 102530 TaxID=3032201 RepID=UPI0024A27485|nr:hypothetical protein [Lentzea sp. NBRC 102530]GLY54884.1 hypothetical protein Lesp01_85390 [Lentzea sp. NBRC 102530]